jgi:hypothetical protein
VDNGQLSLAQVSTWGGPRKGAGRKKRGGRGNVALAAGMKGFAGRAARAINSRVLRRRGSVWGDRYHRRDLESPRDVRNAVVYVMNNPCGTTSQVAISIGVRSQTFSLRHAEGWAEGLHRRLITLVSEGRAGPAS